MRHTAQYQAAVDTPLGVVFRRFTRAGRGVALVTERIVEAVAAVERVDPSECELVMVTDAETGRMLWPSDAAEADPVREP